MLICICRWATGENIANRTTRAETPSRCDQPRRDGSEDSDGRDSGQHQVGPGAIRQGGSEGARASVNAGTPVGDCQGRSGREVGVMAVTSSAAANRLCEKTDWALTQLSVHKGLFLAHMTYLGRTKGDPLLSENFQAWDYGPVLPSLYHELKMFGRKPVKNIFWHSGIPDGTLEAEIIDSIAGQIKGISPTALVHFTHDPKGAWAKNYKPGLKGCVISNKDILDEYEWRPKRAA